MWTQAVWLKSVTLNTIPHWTDAWQSFAEWKKWEFPQSIIQSERCCGQPTQRFKSTPQPTVCTQRPHEQFAQKNLNKVKGLLSLSSPLLIRGPLGPQFIERKSIFVEEGAVWSHFPGSRNNPEFCLISLLHCLELIWARVVSQELNWAWNLALSFLGPQANRETRLVCNTPHASSPSWSLWHLLGAHSLPITVPNRMETETWDITDVCGWKGDSSAVQQKYGSRHM